MGFPQKPVKRLLSSAKYWGISCAFLMSLPITACYAFSEKVFLVTEHLPPYQIIDENNNITGFSVELIEELMKRSGYNYQLSAFPWVRSYNLSLQKPNYCSFSIARIPIREQLFKWVGTITETNNAVVWGLKEKRKEEINNIGEIKNYLTAVNKNDVTHLGLLERGFTASQNLYVLENTDSLINLLVSRPEIDFIVADDITIGYRAKLAGIDINLLYRAFEIKDLPLNFYLACNLKTDKQVIDKLTHSLNQIHQDGFYQKTLSRWQSKMVHIN